MSFTPPREGGGGAAGFAPNAVADTDCARESTAASCRGLRFSKGVSRSSMGRSSASKAGMSGLEVV